MEPGMAIEALAALAQDARLAIFRLLVRHEPQGLAAGTIAERLGVPAATLSFHLSQLSRAGLVVSRRESRFIIYRANLKTMRDLIAFLLDDCCQGAPEMCGFPREGAGDGTFRPVGAALPDSP